MAITEQLTLDVSGYKQSLNDVTALLTKFSDAEDKNNKALETAKGMMEKAGDGTRTFSQQIKLLKDANELLAQSYAELTDEERENAEIGGKIQATIRANTTRTNDLTKAINAQKESTKAAIINQSGLTKTLTATSTAASTAGVSVGVLDKALKILNLSNPLGWVTLGILALKGLWDQFMKAEKVADFVHRSMARVSSVFETVWAAITNWDFSNIGDKIKNAWEAGGEMYDAEDAVDTWNALNRKQMDDLKTTLDDIKGQFLAGKATKEQLNKAIADYKKVADQGEEIYRKAAFMALKKALGDASGLAGEELNKLTNDFINSTDKAQFLSDHHLENFEQQIRQAEEKYDDYIDFRKNSASAIREANNTILNYEKSHTAQLVTQWGNERKEAQKHVDELAKILEDSQNKLYPSSTEGPGSARINKGIDSKTKGREKNTVEEDYNFNSAIYGKIKESIKDTESLESATKSLYDSVKSFDDIENPFDFFDAVFGVADSIFQIIDATTQLANAISRSSPLIKKAAQAKKKEEGETFMSAIAKTFDANASIPFVGAIIAAASVAAIIAAMVAASHKKNKFALGGTVPGASFQGDHVPIWANSGEVILNQNEQAVVRNLVGGTGKQTVHVTGEFKAHGRDLRLVLDQDEKLTKARR